MGRPRKTWLEPLKQLRLKYMMGDLSFGGNCLPVRRKVLQQLRNVFSLATLNPWEGAKSIIGEGEDFEYSPGAPTGNLC